MNDRGMKTVGRESSIVFSDGNGTGILFTYPRYRTSSNGFVRGPHNEQLSRGDQGLEEAKAAIIREIQATIDRQARLGRTPLGCTDCFLRYEDMPRTRHEPNVRNGIFQVNLRGYWSQEHQQCWDQVTYVFRMRAGYVCERTVYTPPLRTLPFDDVQDAEHAGRYTYQPHNDIDPETGEVTWYTESGTPRQIKREFRVDLNTTTRQSVDLCWTDFKSVLATFQNEYLAWECDTNLDALEQLVQGYLDASSIGRALNPVAGPFAEAMQAAGFNVSWNFQENTEDFTLRIQLSEHAIVITNNGDPKIVCQFLNDEERLTALRRLRLEQEVIDSRKFLEEHREQEQP